MKLFPIIFMFLKNKQIFKCFHGHPKLNVKFGQDPLDPSRCKKKNQNFMKSMEKYQFGDQALLPLPGGDGMQQVLPRKASNQQVALLSVAILILQAHVKEFKVSTCINFLNEWFIQTMAQIHKLSPSQDLFHSILCFEEVSTLFGKVYVKENSGIVSMDAGIMSAFASADRENNKIDIEDLVQVNTGISHTFAGNIKVCSDEEGKNVIDHLGFELVWDESPEAIGNTQNSVGVVGLIE